MPSDLSRQLEQIVRGLDSLDRKAQAASAGKWTYVRKLAVDDEIDRHLSQMAENGWEMDAIFRQAGREATVVYEVVWRKKE